MLLSRQSFSLNAAAFLKTDIFYFCCSSKDTIFVKTDQKILIRVAVILFGHFYLLIRESFPIQKWSLFSQFSVFWGTFFPNCLKIFPKCKGKGSFPNSQIKSLSCYHPVVLKYEMGNFGGNGAKWAISGQKGAKWATFERNGHD